VNAAADALVEKQRAAGVEPIGLTGDFPGLKAVYREGDPDADKLRRPADFYSADTFNYVTLDISADGKSLSVNTWGIDSYAPDSFPEPGEVTPPRRILGFGIEADWMRPLPESPFARVRTPERPKIDLGFPVALWHRLRVRCSGQALVRNQFAELSRQDDIK